jgi:nicotinamide-nucleotide amidase
VLEAFASQQYTLALAESCTGGWISKVITDQAGSSRVLMCSLVTYSNSSKQALLGVPEETLSASGAVSRETVEAMARGALEVSDATVAAAVSGIAGPGGGTDAKPVGTVWFSIATRKTLRAWMKTLPGNRDQVRLGAVIEVLEELLAASGAAA